MEKDYYKSDNGVTVYDVLEMNDLHYGFYLGNIVKYVMRADKKDDQKTAFEKAFDYLSRYVKACYGEMNLDNFIKFSKSEEYNKIFTSLQALCVADKFSMFVDYIVRHYHKKTNDIPESCEISFDIKDIEAFKDMCINAMIDYVPLLDTIRDILVKCE